MRTRAVGFVHSSAVWVGRSNRGEIGKRLMVRACSTMGNGNGKGEKGEFEVVREKELFRRYQTVYQRDVRYPSGAVVSFDVTANRASEHKSVFVFPFCTKTGSATLLREYEPGQNRATMSVVAGMYEADKHEDLESAARAELHEEAGLCGGELMTLAEDVAADKYSMNKFYYYLALDCETEEIGERDAEEWIQVERGVSLEQVKRIVEEGQMNAPNSVTALLALEKLRVMGFK